MTLAAGTRLGPYEILAPIGVDGMGEGLPRKHVAEIVTDLDRSASRFDGCDAAVIVEPA